VTVPVDLRRKEAMAAVMWHVTMSLDGFIAGPDDAMEWVFDYFSEDSGETAGEVLETTGAIIMGRRTYEVEDRYRGGIYGGAWSGPYFVLTHERPEVVPDWMTGTFINENIEAAVARAAEAAGDKNVGILGANLAKQCLERGLLDEIVIHLAPVLLGDGVRLFAAPGGLRVPLEPTKVARTGALTDLRFRVSNGRPTEAVAT
jgi:dihydrofolate reductase